MNPEQDELTPTTSELLKNFIAEGDRDGKFMDRFRAILKQATETDMDIIAQDDPRYELFIMAACMWEWTMEETMEQFDVSEGVALWMTKRIMCSWLFPFEDREK